jgi:F0F1-type ATP synthase membrane subunit b/b'
MKKIKILLIILLVICPIFVKAETYSNMITTTSEVTVGKIEDANQSDELTLDDDDYKLFAIVGFVIFIILIHVVKQSIRKKKMKRELVVNENLAQANNETPTELKVEKPIIVKKAEDINNISIGNLKK